MRGHRPVDVCRCALCRSVCVTKRWSFGLCWRIYWKDYVASPALLQTLEDPRCHASEVRA